MKHALLQKTALSAMALLASLALSAQAGTRATVSSARNTHGSQHRGAHNPKVAASTSFHKLLFPDSTYMIDDGTAEDSVGFGDGSSNIESLWFNQFAVIPGATSISTVEVAYGTPNFPDPSLNGEPVTVCVWSDANGDGDPSDAVLLGSVAGTIQNAGTDTFVHYNFSPAVQLPAGATSFFVGYMTPAFNGGFQQFPAALDENSTLHRQSWVAANAAGGPVNIQNPGQNDTVGRIDDFGLPGNWLVRADSGNGSPTPTPTMTPPPPGQLWYNGDFDGTDGLANEQDTFAQGYAHVFDDFNVTDDSGWDVSSVYSNDLISTTVTGATWEIHQGITNGNGGTVVASGMTATPTVTPTGRNGFGFTEFTVSVPTGTLHLDPGTYYLNVTPIGSLDGGRSFDSTTSGANCIGTPCGSNGNSFFDAPTLFGVVFGPTSDQGSQFHDFSMGVNGEVGGGGGPLSLQSAVSRKTQGSAGTFDINLPLSGNPGIEDRGGSSHLTIVMTFNNNITAVGGATTTCGNVTGTAINGNTVTVSIGGVDCDQSVITIGLTGVMDDQGNTANASVDMGLLVGDVNGDGVVNQSDTQILKANRRQPVTEDNFRADLSADGEITNKDIAIIRRNSSHSL